VIDVDGHRKELKFIVDEGVLKDVENRISGVMHRDIHQKGDYYRIRSVYLDSPDYKCLRENQSGVSLRHKFRLRAYDLSDKKIVAEIKTRHADTISKASADISRESFDAIISGDKVLAPMLLNKDRLQYKDGRQDTIDRYILKIAGERFEAATIVEYERCAYVYDLCNVRITFDRNVSASKDFSHFFDENMNSVAVIEGSRHVLEIKYDEFLPEEIRILLGGLGLERSSCSKYVRCVSNFI